MRSLILAAVVNGFVAVPLVLLLMRISSDASVLGEHVGGRLSRTMLGVTFAVLAACAVALVVSLAR